MLSQKNVVNDGGKTGPSTLKKVEPQAMDSNEITPNDLQKLDSLQKQSSIDRCQIDSCRKKLGIVQKSMSCKCEMFFCSKHNFPSKHACTYDFRMEGLNKLKEQLVAVRSEKITQI